MDPAPNGAPAKVEVADDTPRLFEHVAKPEWGVAVMLWERDGKRGYRFEDGRTRVFKSGYYKLLREIDAAADRVQRLLAAAERARDESSTPSSTEPVRRSSNAVTIDEQIEFLLSNNEGGFRGEQWRAAHREPAGESSPLKRHREPAVAKARDMLSDRILASIIDEQRWADGIASLSEVLGDTDLVTARQRALVEGLAESHQKALVEALRAVLYGEAAFGIRFERWVAALASAIGKPPPWQLATAPLALVFPDEHMCVRPNSLRAQAAWMSPRLSIGKDPGAPQYDRALDMARRVRERLVAAELEPADLLDVHDFMWITLRPKARDEILERRRLARRAGMTPAPTAPAESGA